MAWQHRTKPYLFREAGSRDVAVSRFWGIIMNSMIYISDWFYPGWMLRYCWVWLVVGMVTLEDVVRLLADFSVSISGVSISEELILFLPIVIRHQMIGGLKDWWRWYCRCAVWHDRVARSWSDSSGKKWEQEGKFYFGFDLIRLRIT